MDTRNVQSSETPGDSGEAEFAARLNAEFDRLSRVIASGTPRSRGFTVEELDALQIVIEEKRAEFRAGRATGFWIEYWQEPGRVHSVFRSDDRTKAIYQARLSRRPNGEPPMRYMGFSDDGKHRTFRFSPLPVIDGGMCQIRIALSLFGRNGIALQEGPALCATILTEAVELTRYEATRDDVERFLESNRKPLHKTGSHFHPKAPVVPRTEFATESNKQ